MHDLNALKVNYQLAVQKGNILLRDNWYVGHVRTKAVFLNSVGIHFIEEEIMIVFVR